MNKYKQLIYVPKTMNDMFQDYYGNDNINSFNWYLSENEFNNLIKYGVLDYFNKMYYEKKLCFNFLGLEEYEDDYICYQYLFFFKDELYDKLSSFQCKTEIEKLKYMINMAIECKTILGFYL